MFPAWFVRLASWWRRRRRGPLDHLHFVLYTRRGCHLCEVAWRRLRSARRRYQFILEEVDVDTEPALAARYGSLVPVVTVNGKIRFRGAVSPVLLDRLLHAENQRVQRALKKRSAPF